jgi:glucosamine--fructose-6-phosphate aminotransferase (isomerizing)
MCGIIGFIGDKNCYPYLLLGLKLLQNRGYDSAGISVISKNIMHNLKYASTNEMDSIKNLEENIGKLPAATFGIAHTRWATHGRKTDENAHPHLSMDGTISVVHNGIIDNYLELKEFLMKKGYNFSSQTDTEVISQMLQYFLDEYNNDLFISLDNLCNTLNGTWACLIQSSRFPNTLIALKNGSPLLFARNKNGYFFTSEISGFQNEVNDYIIVKDKVYYVVDYTDDKILTKHIKHGLDFDEFSQSQKMHQIDKQLIDLSPDPYPHWMIKEIYDQIESSKRATNNGGRLEGKLQIKLGGLNEHREKLLEYKRICFLACGTSYHAGLFGSIIFSMFQILESVKVCDASEFYEYNYEPNTLYIVLSQSGETKDVHRAMEIIKSKNGIIISVVNVVESLIAREALCGVYINAGSEKAVASTKSFTNQVIVLVLIAMWLYKNHPELQDKNKDTLFQKLREDLLELPDCIDKAIRQNIDVTKKLAVKLAKHNHIFCLGRGLLFPIALEAALKIKEISYIHAEGFCGGALKHGPFALIEEGTPILIISNNDDHGKRMESAAEEVLCRGAHTILLTNDEKCYKPSVYKDVVFIPKLRVLSPILSIVPMQLLAYHIGILKNITVDQPKSLAKVVTVDG